jgi:undecaprenyl-diphosphatase
MAPDQLINVIILAVLEGLTEFLPVSSTGHLILMGEVLGFQGPAETTFKVVIQLGAILAVIVAYRDRLWSVSTRLHFDPEAQAFVRNILLGFLPAMVVGLIAYNAIKQMLETPQIVAWALIIGGILILIIDRRAGRMARFTSIEMVPWKTALIIGVVQCLAMIPGVSRSGATIMGALLLGVDRKTAAEYTFFLAIPTMIAATTYDLYRSWALLNFEDLTAIALGFSIAFVCALAVVKTLVGLVGRFGFAPFAWYRIALGSAALIWFAVR